MARFALPRTPTAPIHTAGRDAGAPSRQISASGFVTGNSADGFCIKYAILWVFYLGYGSLRKMDAIMGAIMPLNGRVRAGIISAELCGRIGASELLGTLHNSM